MGKYKHILIADDLSENAVKVREKAFEVSQTNDASMCAIHVVELLSDYFKAFDPRVEGNIMHQVFQKMKKIYRQYNLSEAQLIVEKGIPKQFIPDFA